MVRISQRIRAGQISTDMRVSGGGRSPATSTGSELARSPAPEISYEIAGRQVSTKVLAAVGTLSPVTFCEADDLGRELIARWEARQEPPRGSQYWGALAALAWLTTHDLAIVARMAPFMPGALECHCYHELACLRRYVHERHCRCIPVPTSFEDCRCLETAVEKLRDALRAERLQAMGWFLPDRSWRSLTPFDLLGIGRAPSRAHDSIRLLIFANGLAAVRFPTDILSNVFPRNPMSITDTEVLAWIRQSGHTNSKVARAAYRSLPQFERDKTINFDRVWKLAFPDRGRGRPRKGDAK